MELNAVGFYWTLPVPWVGFTSLPRDINEAARKSRTIRYQRDAIRAYAKQERYRLIHEEIFLEIEPDRGSDEILESLAKVEKICQARDAILLLMDFSVIQGHRSHGPMTEWTRRTGIKHEVVYPDILTIGGRTFDPHTHFRGWREKQKEWRASKPQRSAKALFQGRALRAEGYSFREIAEALNAEHIRSPSGKPWAEDNVRKFLMSSSL